MCVSCTRIIAHTIFCVVTFLRVVKRGAKPRGARRWSSYLAVMGLNYIMSCWSRCVKSCCVHLIFKVLSTYRAILVVCPSPFFWKEYPCFCSLTAGGSSSTFNFVLPDLRSFYIFVLLLTRCHLPVSGMGVCHRQPPPLQCRQWRRAGSLCVQAAWGHASGAADSQLPALHSGNWYGHVYRVFTNSPDDPYGITDRFALYSVKMYGRMRCIYEQFTIHIILRCLLAR